MVTTTISDVDVPNFCGIASLGLNNSFSIRIENPTFNVSTRKGKTMAGEIIRQGDPTSHGGIVLEGSPLDICHGKPISFIGHQVLCPKCKGKFPIIEGAPVTTFYGKGVALAGMKTACGAILIATQLLDTVEYAGGDHSGEGTEQRARSDSSHTTSSNENPSGTSGAAASDIQEEHTYKLIDSNGSPVSTAI